MKILEVKQLKEIQVSEGSFIYPFNNQTKIILDKKSLSHKKEHQLIYQQRFQYGTEGDCCTYLSNSELLKLEIKGMIKIRKSKQNNTI